MHKGKGKEWLATTHPEREVEIHPEKEVRWLSGQSYSISLAETGRHGSRQMLSRASGMDELINFSVATVQTNAV